jgi:hypothetical protein|tara:strand:+ start:1859 stop:2035 length:177 start_codon:yes stop_codon:yes gene_type:complete
MAKKVLKYSEEEFVTLLENIVKRVKKEERIEESIKNRKSKISENNRRTKTSNRRLPRR